MAGIPWDQLIGLPDWVQMQLEGIAMAEVGMHCTMDWAGIADIPCVGGPEFGGKRIDEGGWRPNASLKIKVRCALFPAGVGLPQEKQTIMYKRATNSTPKKYRIDSITNYYDAWLLLECQDPSQGG